jgi:hypothetical protein
MNGLAGFKTALANLLATGSGENEKTLRGCISGDAVFIGGRAYPYDLAIDCSVNDGDYVYCLLTKNNRAVIVGA